MHRKGLAVARRLPLALLDPRSVEEVGGAGGAAIAVAEPGVHLNLRSWKAARKGPFTKEHPLNTCQKQPFPMIRPSCSIDFKISLKSTSGDAAAPLPRLVVSEAVAVGHRNAPGLGLLGRAQQPITCSERPLKALSRRFRPRGPLRRCLGRPDKLRSSPRSAFRRPFKAF